MKSHKSNSQSSGGTQWVGLEELEPRMLLSVAAMQSLFDEQFYLQRNPDVANAVIEGWFATGFDHFLCSGHAEGRQPTPFFEEDYYLDKYPDAQSAVDDETYQSGFEHYADVGQGGGYSPSVFFDEEYYLATYQDIATAVDAQALRSGFEHFVNYGFYEQRNPSPFFHEQYYRKTNPDVDNAIVQYGAFRSGLHHFLEYGAREARYSTFNEQWYLAANPDVDSAVNDGWFASGLDHYLLFGAVEGRAPSPLYNEYYYLAMNPTVQSAVASGQYRSGLDHMVTTGQFEERYGAFDELRYLSLYPDVANAVMIGIFPSGLSHFVNCGNAEGRSYSPDFVEKSYLSANPTVKTAVDAGTYDSGLEHYIITGQFQGLEGRPTSKEFLFDGTGGGQLKVKVNEVGTYHALAGVVTGYQINLQAIDPTDTIVAAGVEITGALYQTGWDHPYDKFTPDMKNGQTLTNALLDTHFLLNAGGADWLVGTPTEDNDFQYGLNANGEKEGLGRVLEVTGAIEASARAQDLAFIYVVVPEGLWAYLGDLPDGGVAQGTGSIFSFGQGQNGILIP